jgi:potassium voltage-gated channel Shal-related subfamily D protein 2
LSPHPPLAAVLVHVLVTELITFSALVTILETVPVFHLLPGGIWFGIETSLVALFTVEYVTQQTFWIRLPRQPSLTIVPNANR